MFGSKSTVFVPLSVGEGPVFGLLSFAVIHEERNWTKPVVLGFKLIAQVFANALARRQADTERKRMEEELRDRLLEIEELRSRLEKENIYLREEVRLLVEHTEIVGQSLAIKRVLAQAEQVAGTDATVLLLGETGTGKELLARAIHGLSLRKDRPLVTVNCASLPPTLIESELFGREKGAYTGALTKMIGRFEIADWSTLFLDEIGEIPFDLQSKLLRGPGRGQIRAVGFVQAPARQCAHHCRHQPRHCSGSEGTQIQAGPFLPAECISHYHSTPPGSYGRHSSPGPGGGQGISKADGKR